MKAALLQLSSGDDPAENLKTMRAMLREAAGNGAEFVLTPEVSKELRSLQKLTAAQSATGIALPSVNDYKRIVNQYGRNYTRYIKLMANGG